MEKNDQNLPDPDFDENALGKEVNDMRASVLVHVRKNINLIVKLEDFLLKSVLGRGTFGKVYLAELSHNKRLYAIKSIRKDILLDTDQV